MPSSGVVGPALSIGSSLLGIGGSKSSGDRSVRANSAATNFLVDAGNQGIDRFDQALSSLEETFAPFEEFGLRGLEQAEGNFFGNLDTFDDPTGAVLDDPFFQALADESQRRIFNNQAAGGRLGSPETGVIFQDALLRLGPELLSRKRAEQNNQAKLSLLPAQIGGDFAVRRGAAEIESALGIADLLAQIGNARASGAVNQADIKNERDSNILGGIGGALGAIGGIFG